MFVLAKKEMGVNDKWLPWYVKKLKAGLGVVLPGGAPAFVGQLARKMREERTAQGAYQDDGYRAEHPTMLAAIGLLAGCGQSTPTALGTLEWDRITVPAPAAEA